MLFERLRAPAFAIASAGKAERRLRSAATKSR